MICPNCEADIKGVDCPSCGQESPQDSVYCCKCGRELGVSEEANAIESDMDCPSCGQQTPLHSSFCCSCGRNLRSGQTEASPDPVDDSGEVTDFSSRVLCSDGNCIGIIGPDGKCSECGKPAGPAD
ncbi:MAG: zinc ribbon domain-containing protein [Deltaproteobacteria bacterium]|nr:zinc ribbon domain-containing protein [Deltaproteobacteria bacterium]